MHIFISGGTGRNGTLVVQSALRRGHTVTVLARNPDNVEAQPNLTVVKGSPSIQKDVETALSTPRRPQTIISTLNARRTSDNPFAALSPDSPVDLLTATAKTLVSAVRAVFSPNDEQPLIVFNSALGAGSSWSGLPLLFRALFSISNMSHSIQDHTNMDTYIRSTGLPFVMGRAGRLTDEPDVEPKKVIELPENGKGVGLSSAISRQSLAEWLVDAAESRKWDGKAPVLVN